MRPRPEESMANKNIVWSIGPNGWPEESGELMSQWYICKM